LETNDNETGTNIAGTNLIYAGALPLWNFKPLA
jgi:hypothetical protein